jgi:hypothetical protein
VRFLRRSAVAGLLVLSACGGSSGGDVASPDTDAGVAGSSTSVAPSTPGGSAPAGSELLAFTAPAIGGGEVDASIHQGRPTLLWFWAPW